MSNLKVYPNANTFTVDEASVALSDAGFRDPQLICLVQPADPNGRFMLCFGRGACRAWVTPVEAEELKALGVQVV